MRVLLLCKEPQGGLLTMLPSGGGQAYALRPLSAPTGEAMAAAQDIARGEATLVDHDLFLAAAARLDSAALVQARAASWGQGWACQRWTACSSNRGRCILNVARQQPRRQAGRPHPVLSDNALMQQGIAALGSHPLPAGHSGGGAAGHKRQGAAGPACGAAAVRGGHPRHAQRARKHRVQRSVSRWRHDAGGGRQPCV